MTDDTQKEKKNTRWDIRATTHKSGWIKKTVLVKLIAIKKERRLRSNSATIDWLINYYNKNHKEME